MSSQHKIETQESTEVQRRLRALRGERSQEEFAKLVGLTRSALANYENGRTLPKPSILRQISMKAGISDDFLVSGALRNEYELNLVVAGQGMLNECHESSDELAMVDALRALHPSSVKTVVGLLLKEIGESAETRAKLGKGLGSTVAALDDIHRSDGAFTKGGNSL